MSLPEVDPEKGEKRHASQDIERPHSLTHSDASSRHSDVEDVIEKSKSKDERCNHEDFIPAATVGEPSGNKAYDETCEPCRTRSRTSSLRSRTLVVIPRSKRRGLFGSIAWVPEAENPYHYKNSTKWTITAAVSLATAAAPMGSSIFYPALPLLSSDLNASKTITNMSVALYMLAMSIFPLWWSSFSETLGRRTIYLASFALFVLASILCAISTNITMLIVFRIMSGGASASVQAVGAGTIADIWETFERGKAMGMFYLGPLLGPLLAPIFGGILAQAFGWKSTMWFLAVYGFVIFVGLLFLLPETLARKRQVEEPVDSTDLSRMSSRQSAAIRSRRFAAAGKRFFIDPLKVVLLLRFPAVSITVFIAAIAFAALFIANIAIQEGYSGSPYNFGQLIVGLLYAPAGVGYILAALFGGRWIDNIMAREAKKANRYDEHGKLIYLPEDRMRENAWIANTVYPLALLMFGWTIHYGIHWAVPSVAMFFFGIASMLVFAVATTMLTEFVRTNSSAGVAVNNFVRNILTCVGTIVAAPWIDAMGSGWVFTIIAIFCLVAGFSGIWILKRNAQKWRTSMDEALGGNQ